MYLTVAELAAEEGVHPDVVRSWLEEGLPSNHESGPKRARARHRTARLCFQPIAGRLLSPISPGM